MTYHVYMMGFLPGFPYMGDLPPELALPRRENPRTKVPAGSIAIATTLTAIYALESPGGWHLIGRTPVPLWDLRARSARDPRGRRQGDVRADLSGRVRGDAGAGGRRHAAARAGERSLPAGRAHDSRR